MSEPQGPSQPLVLSLATLTVVSGVVDAVSYLGLGHVFTANMTGNVVLIGFALAGAPGFSIAASATALAAFLAGAATGGRIGLRIHEKRSLLVTAVSLEAGFTVVAAIIAGTVAVLSTGWPRYTVIAVLGYAMGIRNSVVRNMGVADMTTTVLTMTLTGFAADSSLGGGHNPNATRRDHLGGLHARRRARRGRLRHPRAPGCRTRPCRGPHRRPCDLPPPDLAAAAGSGAVGARALRRAARPPGRRTRPGRSRARRPRAAATVRSRSRAPPPAGPACARTALLPAA